MQLELMETGAVTCANCGKEYKKVRERQRFCCRKCKTQLGNRQAYGKLEAMRSIALSVDHSFFNQLDQEAIAMYRDKRFGHKMIAKIQSRNSNQLRRILIRAGVYSPPVKTKASIEKAEAKENRKKERERLKKEIEAELKGKNTPIRKAMSVCMRGLRAGVRVQTTCRKFGYKYNKLMTELRKRPHYKTKFSSGTKWSDIYRAAKFRSSIFKDESDMQDQISEIIPNANRETDKGGGRIDFTVGLDVAIEIKVQTNAKSIYSLIGQCMHARSLGYKRTIGITPSDYRIAPSLSRALKYSGIENYTEQTIRAARLNVSQI